MPSPHPIPGSSTSSVAAPEQEKVAQAAVNRTHSGVVRDREEQKPTLNFGRGNHSECAHRDRRMEKGAASAPTTAQEVGVDTRTAVRKIPPSYRVALTGGEGTAAITETRRRCTTLPQLPTGTPTCCGGVMAVGLNRAFTAQLDPARARGRSPQSTPFSTLRDCLGSA